MVHLQLRIYSNCDDGLLVNNILFMQTWDTIIWDNGQFVIW